ncbi:MAG: sigma-70 family RNA polymerase sigma factor [Planctomycetes bacterium]|nr:sigma-70 family RNA polymerase sigma factor [Planctomycetota bacterium]
MDRLDASAAENDWATRVGATYVDHIGALQGVLTKRLRAPRPIVEDALHDVFCAVLRLRQIPGQSRDGALSFSYLCAAGQRRVRRLLQQGVERQRRIQRDALRDAVGGSNESLWASRARDAESNLLHEVDCAMRGLSRRQRDVLRVAFSTVGCGRDEARMLGVSAGAHAVEKHRAITALRQALHVDVSREVSRRSR